MTSMAVLAPLPAPDVAPLDTPAKAGAADSGRPLRILMICSRDPRGRMSGRKMVLQTMLHSFAELGHQVTLCHFGPSEGPLAPAGAAVFLRLPLPSAPEFMANGLVGLVSGRSSINEALYKSHRAQSIIRRLIDWNGYDLIVTDMVRTARYGASSGLPWIADLDDLLSERYARMAEAGQQRANLLGYHGTPLARGLGKVLARMMPLLLRRESSILGRRENAIARSADLVSLVSESEAEALARSSGRSVADTPMAVPGPAWSPDEAPRPFEAVFLGGLDYGPNLTALRRFDTEVIPALAALGEGDLKLHVVGTATPQQRRGLSDAIVFRGYVDDLDSELQRYKVMVAPAATPGGVKTKIIAAAMNGTLILAHPSALGGMGLTPGRDVLVWTGPAELAAHLKALKTGRIDREAMTREARKWAQSRYAPEVLRERWRRNIAVCLAAAQSRSARSSAAVAGRARLEQST